MRNPTCLQRVAFSKIMLYSRSENLVSIKKASEELPSLIKAASYSGNSDRETQQIFPSHQTWHNKEKVSAINQR